MEKKAVVVVSGGMDSVTLLHDTVKSKCYDHIEGLSLYYGSKHNDIEIPFAKENCEILGIPHTIINLEEINQYFKSDLLKSGGVIPEGKYDGENMRATVVPFRNGIILSIAAGFADSKGAKTLFIGSHSGDHYIYPDCRPDFNKHINEAIRLGTETGVEVKALYETWDKTKIIARGLEINVDYSKTWTCYNPQSINGKILSCGRCGSCTEREQAFYNNKIEDPKEYVDKKFYKKVLNLD